HDRLDAARVVVEPSAVVEQGVLAFKVGRDLFHSEVEAARLDVHEDGPGAEPGDGAAGGEKGVRRGDDLVAGADAQGHQRHEQRIGTGGDADGVRHAQV